MAIGEGAFGNQTGIGQGLAYVLPQSRAEGYALQLAQDESKQLASAAAAQLKRQQAVQDSIGKQFSAQKLPALWSPYNSVVADNSAQWQQKAAQFNASTGKSPFTDPELMKEYNTKVNGLAQQSKDLGTKYGKLYSAAVADAGNKYTPESVKAVLDFEEDIKKDPMGALNKKLPELKLQPASFNDFAKLIKPVSDTKQTGTLDTVRANRESHIDQTLNTLMSNPEKWGGMALEQFGLDLTKPTYPVVGKNGRKVYPTNDATVATLVDGIIASPNEGVETFAEFGVDPADQFAKEKLVDAIKKQNQGIGKILTQSADLADSKVSTKTAVSYDARNQQRADARLAKSESRGGASSNVGEVQQITIPYGKGKGNERGVVEFDEYVPISLSKKNFAGAEYIDLKTGKPGGKLSSSNDYEVVGVGNAPIITKGNFKGAVSQPNFANSNPDAVQRKPIIHVQTPATANTPAKDYFVPYDRLPENVKNSKSVREALVNFKPATPAQTKTATPTKSKNDPLGLF